MANPVRSESCVLVTAKSGLNRSKASTRLPSISKRIRPVVCSTFDVSDPSLHRAIKDRSLEKSAYGRLTHSRTQGLVNVGLSGGPSWWQRDRRGPFQDFSVRRKRTLHGRWAAHTCPSPPPRGLEIWRRSSPLVELVRLRRGRSTAAGPPTLAPPPALRAGDMAQVATVGRARRVPKRTLHGRWAAHTCPTPRLEGWRYGAGRHRWSGSARPEEDAPRPLGRPHLPHPPP